MKLVHRNSIFLISLKSSFICFLILLPKSNDGRTIVKRSPQLSLTVIDEPETTPREHPPSPEDIEERRQALVKALIPGGNGGGSGGGGLQTLTDLGVDLVGGSLMNSGDLLAPLRNATKRARENFPRAGDVLNRFVDSAREYRKNTAGVLRKSASTKVNNGIKIFTTFSARGTEVLGGVFKLLRTLLDNFTLAVQNLSARLSRGIAGFARNKTDFLANNFIRLRKLLNNQRLFQPAKEAASLGGSLVRGLAQDFTSIQPLISEGIKSKINVGTRLIPRIRVSTILSPLGDDENKPCSTGDDDVDGEVLGGYGKKRDSEEAVPDGESSPTLFSGEEGSTTSSSMSLEDVPKDILELLGSSKSETQASSENNAAEDLGISTTSSKSTKLDSNSNEIEKDVELSSKTSTSKTSSTRSRNENYNNHNDRKSTTNSVNSYRKKTNVVIPNASSSTTAPEKKSFIEDLFGLNSS